MQALFFLIHGVAHSLGQRLDEISPQNLAQMVRFFCTLRLILACILHPIMAKLKLFRLVYFSFD